MADWVTEQSLGCTAGRTSSSQGQHGMWLSRPRSSFGVSKPGSRTLRGGGQRPGPGSPRGGPDPPQGQGDWTLAEGLLVIHSASPGPSGAHVGLWAQHLPSKGPGHGSGSCLMGKRAVPSPRGRCPPLGRLPGWVSSFLLHMPLGGAPCVFLCAHVCALRPRNLLGGPVLFPLFGCDQHSMSQWVAVGGTWLGTP